MPFEAAIVIAVSILVATFVGICILIGSRRHAAKEDELRRVASARGWTFASVSEKGYRVHRWKGATDGVSWQAESLTRSSGNSKNDRYHHIARWHGAWSPGISGAIVCMGVPKGKETTGTRIGDGSSWIARLAQKAAGTAIDKSIDVYFGEGPGREIDAAALLRVDSVKIAGFVVMASDKDEGSRVLSQGFERALVTAVGDQASVLSEEKRPWVLLRPHAVSLARMARFRDVTELERFVHAGVALTRAFKFGRSTS